MLSREDRILSEILVSRGIVPRATVESCASVRESLPGGSLFDLIADSGEADRASLEAAAEEARDLDRALAPALPETRRLGEFRVIREIGRGGMGIVYEAEQEPLGRRVALKVLPAASALDERQALRFLREARAVARLHHPGIVPLYATGHAEGVLYFAMELIEGETLAAALARGPLPPKRAAEVAAEVARALDHAHEAGFVHRDIKPENILLGPDGHAHVADFGLVHEAVAGSLTLSHHVLGSPAFMAPEQALGEAADKRADVYSLGAVLYMMLSGEPPYRGVVPSAVIGKLLREDPPPLAARSPGVPGALVHICRRAMARNPAERFPSAADAAAALERFLAGDLSAMEDERAGSRRGFRSRSVRAALFAVLVFVGAAAALLWSSRSPTGIHAKGIPLAKAPIALKGEACCSAPAQPGCESLDLDLGTGVADSGGPPGPIAVGEPDDDWTVIVDPNGGPVPRAAVVVTPHPIWKEIPGSRWVSANIFGRNGKYLYQTCFCLASTIREPALDIGALSDDHVTLLSFNNHVLDKDDLPQYCGIENPCRFTIKDASWFVPGLNCLVVEVENTGGSPTGLDVSANVRGHY